MKDIDFRLATAVDSVAIAGVYLASRKTFVGFAPPVHSDAEVGEWIARVLVPSGNVTVAVCGDMPASRRSADPHGARAILGMMALAHEAGAGWIDHLYLRPDAVGHGIGSRLLEHAKQHLTPPIRLYTFQENRGARRFYERHGFLPVACGDGSGNEEGCPDTLYEWRPARRDGAES